MLTPPKGDRRSSSISHDQRRIRARELGIGAVHEVIGRISGLGGDKGTISGRETTGTDDSMKPWGRQQFHEEREARRHNEVAGGSRAYLCRGDPPASALRSSIRALCPLGWPLSSGSVMLWMVLAGNVLVKVPHAVQAIVDLPMG